MSRHLKHRRQPGAAWVAVAASLAVLACAHRPPAEFDVGQPMPEPGPVAADLSGTWQYNAQESDRAGRAAQLRGREGGREGAGMPGEGGFPGGGMGGSGGFGGQGEYGGRGRGGGSRRGAEGERDRPPAAIDTMLLRPAQRLVIEQTDSTITIGRADGAPLTLWFDGRDVVVRDTSGEAQAVSGSWNRARFEVRRPLGPGRTLTQAYVLSSDGRRLVVLVQVSGGEQGPTTRPESRRVYDRVSE